MNRDYSNTTQDDDDLLMDEEDNSRSNKQLAQLDLANAYINMGDEIEARNLLENLLDSDDLEIRNKAEELLHKII